MITKELSDVLIAAASASSDSIPNILTASADGELRKASRRSVGDFVFSSITSSENLDNPTHKGVFNVSAPTVITKPTKGTGWQYGYVVNLAVTTGIQIWFNFDGYVAVRGKGSANGSWSEWAVMQKM